MGALIISRYPRHPVGWLLSAVGMGAAISLTCEAYSLWVLDHDGPGSQAAGHVTGWVSLLLGGPYALTLLAIMFLIVPDGALLSRRWLIVAGVGVTGFASFVSGLVLLRGLSAGDMVLDEGETGGAAVTVLFTVGLWLITAALTAAVVSAVIRMRAADGVLHQQLRWITLSGVFLPAGLIWRQVAQGLNGGDQSWSATLPLLVAYCLIPICTAVAILRYRLYNLELIINRAVVYAVGSAFVAAAYVVLVVVPRRPGRRSCRRVLAVSAGDRLVALAFQPLRKRLSRFADRVAYGARAVPYEALADFSRRLGDAPAPQTLLPAVAAAAGQMVSARRAHGQPHGARRRDGGRYLAGRTPERRRSRSRWPCATRARCSGRSPCRCRRDARRARPSLSCCRTSRTRPRWLSATPLSRRSPRGSRRAGPADSGARRLAATDTGGARCGVPTTGSGDLPRRLPSARPPRLDMRRLQAAAEAGLPLTGVRGPDRRGHPDPGDPARAESRGVSDAAGTRRHRPGAGVVPRQDLPLDHPGRGRQPREGVASAPARRPQRTSAASKPRRTAPRAVASSSASRVPISPCTSTGCRPRVWTCSGWTTASRPWPGRCRSSPGPEEYSRCGSPSTTCRCRSWPAAPDRFDPGRARPRPSASSPDVAGPRCRRS